MTATAIHQARKIKNLHARTLLEKRNVVGVGLGYKISNGVNTGELSLVVLVTRKSAPEALSAEDMVPAELDGLKTDVVESGVLRAFQSPTDRWRPVVPPGVSLGHYHITAGTFGCLVRRGDERFILSNNHVLADLNRGQPGDPILQPGPTDGGTADDRIATLADYIPLDFGTAPPECPIAASITQLLNALAGAVGSSHRVEAMKQTPGVNLVDAALARPLSPDTVSGEILHIGVPTGVAEATLGLAVQKTGRTTGYTQGVITQVDATVRIEYGDQSALFSGQLVAGAMSKPGDSGSAVLDMEKRVVGLLFAGSDTTTIINPIAAVLSALDVELA